MVSNQHELTGQVLSFRSIKLVGYPIPADGNVFGELLRAQGRHCLRPAHVHVLIFKPGMKTLIPQVFIPDDPRIDDDVQFGVTRNLIGRLVRHDDAAADAAIEPSSYSVDHIFVMDAGDARLPVPPIK